MITINQQIKGLKTVTVSTSTFPRLFNGTTKIKDISIIKTNDGIDVQTILDEKQTLIAIKEFLKER